MDEMSLLLSMADRMLWTTALVAAPILLSSLVVGLAVGVVQAATSVNEQTLTFVPKLAITALVLVLFGASMMALVGDFLQDIFAQIAQVRNRHAAAVDERARAAFGQNLPTQQALLRLVVIVQAVFAQPLLHARQPLQVHLGLDFRTFGTGAHHRGIGPVTEQQAQRVYEYGFAGAGLAAEYGEAAGQFQL